MSGFVSWCLTICWAVTIGLIVLGIVGLAASPWVNPPDIEIGVGVPAAFTLDPEPRDIRAPGVAVENIHLRDARGSLEFSPRTSGSVAGGMLMLIAPPLVSRWVLAQLRGGVFTRWKLLLEVWGYDYFGGRRTVDVQVRRLRA